MLEKEWDEVLLEDWLKRLPLLRQHCNLIVQEGQVRSSLWYRLGVILPIQLVRVFRCL